MLCFYEKKRLLCVFLGYCVVLCFLLLYPMDSVYVSVALVKEGGSTARNINQKINNDITFCRENLKSFSMVYIYSPVVVAGK